MAAIEQLFILFVALLLLIHFSYRNQLNIFKTVGSPSPLRLHKARKVLTTIYVEQVYLESLCRVEQLLRNLLDTPGTNRITIGKGKAKIMDRRDLMVC